MLVTQQEQQQLKEYQNLVKENNRQIEIQFQQREYFNQQQQAMNRMVHDRQLLTNRLRQAKNPQIIKQMQEQKRQMTKEMDNFKAHIKPYKENKDIAVQAKELERQKKHFDKMKMNVKKDVNNFAYQNKIQNSIPESARGDKVKEDLAIGKARFKVEQEIFMKNGKKALGEFRQHMARHDKDGTFGKMKNYLSVEAEKRMGKTHTLDKMKKEHGQEPHEINKIKQGRDDKAKGSLSIMQDRMNNRRSSEYAKEVQQEQQKMQEPKQKEQNSISQQER